MKKTQSLNSLMNKKIKKVSALMIYIGRRHIEFSEHQQNSVKINENIH